MESVGSISRTTESNASRTSPRFSTVQVKRTSIRFAFSNGHSSPGVRAYARREGSGSRSSEDSSAATARGYS